MCVMRNPCLKFVGDGFGHLECCGRSAHVVRAHLAFAHDRGDGILDALRTVRLTQPVKHHFGGQDGGDRVHFVLPGILGCRAMRRLEHGELFSDVSGAAKAEPANHLGAEVGNDVAVEVGRHQHVVVERVLQQPHGDGVDVGIVHGDVREVLRHLARRLQEQAVGCAHHVGLVHYRNFLAPELPGELEGCADDPLRALLRVDLAGDRVLIAGQVLERLEGRRQFRQHISQLVRDGVELNAAVKILGVLTER